MTAVSRVLGPEPVRTLAGYSNAGGGRGLAAAREKGPEQVVSDLEASGLRGRGGAGFPTGTKWRAVLEHQSPTLPPTVVVNAAEGEPGSFKDRMILRTNPYQVLEGLLIAAVTVGASEAIVALKASFETETARLVAAIEELQAAGWAEGVKFSLVQGPSEYLYGEETALLEVIDGRAPFPRIAPPFRQGVAEVGDDSVNAATAGPRASEEDTTAAPPALVNNVETLANVPGIVANGPEWFRELGTSESPGTIVCTVSGRVQRHGVAEFAMGTPLIEILEELGGGAETGHEIVAVMSGVANPLVPADQLATPASYEGMDAIGSGLGAAGFIVFDDTTDFAAVAHGVSRFLSVESCGQCTPCKQDGRALADLLDQVRLSEADDHHLDAINDRIRTVSTEARCYLALQHERVLASVMSLFPDQLAAHAAGAPAADDELIAAIVDLVEGRFVLDERHRHKQPDWSYDDEDSGQAPADHIDQRAGEEAKDTAEMAGEADRAQADGETAAS